MYQTEMFQAEVAMTDFIAKYRDADKFIEYCRACPNYNTRWSCPTLTFEPSERLAEYDRIHLVSVKMTYDEQTIAAADTPEKVKKTTWDTLFVEKRAMEEVLIGLEEELVGTLSLSSGGCHICEVCSRVDKQACRFPDKMRHSLDAFGFDLTAITEQELGINLCWSKGNLPPYYTLIHALLLPANVTITDDELNQHILDKWNQRTIK